MREALLLDLGAIIFELHRQRRREPELLQAKAAELDAVDAEVRALSLALQDGRGLPELTASGLVATCTACGSLMGSGDRFCPHCGAAAGAVMPGSENGSGAPGLKDAGEAEDERLDTDAGGEETPARDENGAPEERQARALEEQPPGDALRDSESHDSSGTTGNGSLPLANGPERSQDDLVKMAQGKMRVARRWLAQRWPETR